VSEINPQEFGRLQAQVETLIRSDAEKTDLLKSIAEDMNEMKLQMAEANGGWKLLMLLGGSAATAGSALTWVAQHFIVRAP
jgi:hypothetical protein